MTSAPWSASIMVATGPATIVDKSNTRTPSKGPAMLTPRLFRQPLCSGKISLHRGTIRGTHRESLLIARPGLRQHDACRGRPIETGHEQNVGGAESITEQ